MHGLSTGTHQGPSDILCPLTPSFPGRLERLVFFNSPYTTNSGTETFLGFLCVLCVSVY